MVSNSLLFLEVHVSHHGGVLNALLVVAHARPHPEDGCLCILLAGEVPFLEEHGRQRACAAKPNLLLIRVIGRGYDAGVGSGDGANGTLPGCAVASLN